MRLDSSLEPGRDRRGGEAESDIPHGYLDSGQRKSARPTALLIDSNCRKVERIRKILKDGSEGIRTAVHTGKMSINRAYTLIREMEKQNDLSARDSSETLKAAKILISEENFALLKELDGDLGPFDK